MKQEIEFKIKQIVRDNGIIDYSITIPITWKPLLWRLFKFRVQSRVFIISSAKISTAKLISIESKKLPGKLIGDNSTEMSLENADSYQYSLAYIVAAAIQNNGRPPRSGVIKFIAMNFSSLWLSDSVMVAIRKLHLEHFVNAITLIKGTESILYSNAEAEAENTSTDSENLDPSTYA